MPSLKHIHTAIESCRSCPGMCGTPVHGPALQTKIMLLGQAPGPHEAKYGYPFAFTSGKTLFRWVENATGVNEKSFREHIYIAAVARCFPGKSPSGKGDREPNLQEIENCRRHVSEEVKLLKPKLLLAVGKLAIREILGKSSSKAPPLADVVGRVIPVVFHGQKMDMIALPHPSGISVWPNVEPGKTKLAEALKLLSQHPVFKETFS